ncbi:MAG: ABC transporter substrate-binding protein [Patescibacteria group bacterium]|nr:ABC transporter substrate-binding protein [Patescibacteria group bacterium]
MNSKKKIFRYYYWLFIEFFKKHIKLIILSFLISFIIFIFFLSLSPYINFNVYKEKKIGLIGNYKIENPPDEILNKISNGLISIDNKGKIMTILSTHWEIKEEGKRYVFYLKNNLFWNNNQKFSAYDIKYNFEDVSIKVINERTIEFVLNKPLSIFPVYLNKPIVKYPLIGIGGYYKTGKIKTKNNYLKEVYLIPNIKNIPSLRYIFYQNENQLVNAYKKGEITEMTVFKKSIAESFSNWKNTKIEKKVDYSRLLTIFFNFKNSIFNNKNIRDALSMIIDIKKLSDYGEIAKSPIPPNSWAYNPDLKNYNYDPETAKKIIQKERIASLSSILNLVTFFDYYQIADNFVEEMNKIGLPTEIKISSFDKPENFDLLVGFLKIPYDPDQYYYWHSTQTKGNIGSYKNLKVDLLLEKGRSTVNIQEREKNYFDFQKVIRDDPPALFLYFPYSYKIERK